MPLPLIPLVTAVAPKLFSAISNAVSKPATPASKGDFLNVLMNQLTSKSSVQSVQKSLEAMGAGDSQALSGAAALVGRPVLATTGSFTQAGSAVNLPYTLSAPVADAVLEVTDASGTVLSRQALGAKGPGQYTAVFTPPAGQAAGELRYRIVSMDGGRSTVLPAVAGNVTGFTMAGGQPVLQVGAITISLGDVTSIGTSTN